MEDFVNRLAKLLEILSLPKRQGLIHKEYESVGSVPVYALAITKELLLD